MAITTQCSKTELTDPEIECGGQEDGDDYS